MSDSILSGHNKRQRRLMWKYVSTVDHLAETFTKPLSNPRFFQLREAIGVAYVQMFYFSLSVSGLEEGNKPIPNLGTSPLVCHKEESLHLNYFHILKFFYVLHVWGRVLEVSINHATLDGSTRYVGDISAFFSLSMQTTVLLTHSRLLPPR